MIVFASKDLGLRPGQWKALARRARQAGKTTPEFLRRLIEQDLLAAKPFDEILRPIRRDVRRGGISQAALDQLVSRARRGSPGVGRQKARGPKRETPRR